MTDTNFATKAVISLSGGLDSTMLLMHLFATGIKEVRAYSFEYGQKHDIELKKVKKNIKFLQSKGFNIAHQIINLKDVFSDSASSLHKNGDDIPEGHYAEENMKSTVVENRNVIFSSIIYGKALGWANKTNENVFITLGIHGGDHCFTKDTKILTPNGYKTIDKIKIGDKVYSVDPVNQKVEVDTIVNALKTGSNDEIYEINTTTGSIRLTSDHKVYVVNLGEMTNSGFTKSISQKMAKELVEGDILISPYKLPGNNSNKKESINISPIISELIKNELYNGYKTCIVNENIGIITPNGRDMAKYPVDMDAQSLVNLIAWYITEGWSSNQFRSNPCASRFLSSFSQSFYKNLENTVNIEELHKKLGIKISVSKKQDGETTYQFNSVISVLMRSCGENSLSKHIPSWLMNILLQNPGLIPDFLATMIEGDGHYDELAAIYSYSTKSPQLAEDVSLLFRLAGMYVKIYRSKNGQIILSGGCKNRKIGLVRLGDMAMTKIKSIKISHKTEDVYDITVEKNHNFFAGEYGNILIHNCVYPDTRPESHEMAKELFKISNWGSERVDYIAPFEYIDKGEVLSSGISAMEQLHFTRAEIKKVLKNTHTCYNPDEKGHSCASCGSCTERLEAFEKAKSKWKWIKKDPIPYQ
jgi:7-cyano-7-deazaguanine synthase